MTCSHTFTSNNHRYQPLQLSTESLPPHFLYRVKSSSKYSVLSIRVSTLTLRGVTGNMSAYTSSNPSYDYQEQLQALKIWLESTSDLDVLKHCLGLAGHDNVPGNAKDMAELIKVVCFDLEHWSSNTDEMVEIGIAQFSVQDMLAITKPTRQPAAHGSHAYGDHGEELMKQIQFNLLRIIENSHLDRTHLTSKGPDGNRFGFWRFVTFEEARRILTKTFAQPITGAEGLHGLNHPIVVLGHNVWADKAHFKAKETAFDLDGPGTVVRTIDTQNMVVEAGLWKNKDQIGLSDMVEALWFEHSDLHTAANDAARTAMAAIQLALYTHPCKTAWIHQTMQEVAGCIERHSRLAFRSIGGIESYCWRCGGNDHMKEACPVPGSVLHCDDCHQTGQVSSLKDRHITGHCPFAALRKAGLRREKDGAKTFPKKFESKPEGQAQPIGIQSARLASTTSHGHPTATLKVPQVESRSISGVGHTALATPGQTPASRTARSSGVSYNFVPFVPRGDRDRDLQLFINDINQFPPLGSIPTASARRGHGSSNGGGVYTQRGGRQGGKWRGGGRGGSA